MKKGIRLLSALLAAGLFLGTVTACNNGDDDKPKTTKGDAPKTTEQATSEGTDKQDDGTESDATEDDDTGATADQPQEVIELTFYNADGQEDPWDDPVAKEITRQTGVKLKTSYPINQSDQTVALMIAEQNYPDMIFAKGDAGKLIEAGALVNLEPLIDAYGPNLKKMYGEEYDKLRHSTDDPSIYQFSSYGVKDTPFTTSGVAQIQWQVLKDNDYEVPQTLEDFENMIKASLEAQPQTEDGQDRIGLSLSTADWHWMITLGNPAGFIAEAQPDNGQWIVSEDNEAIYKFRSEKIREYMKWLNRMYDEGVLDPDFATQTHEDYIAKIAAGRVVALTDTDWDYGDGEKILKADGKYNLTYAPLPITLEDDQKCPVMMYQGLTTGYGVGITTHCEEPEAAMRFLDFIASDEGQVLVNWGIEGENYYVEDGKRIMFDEDIKGKNEDPDYGKKTGVGFHNYPFPAYGNGIEDETGNTYTTNSRENVIKEYNDEQKAALEAWDAELLTDIFPQPDEFETPKFSAIWAYTKPAEFDEIGNQLDEVAWSALVSMIIGSPDDFDAAYDKMITDLEGVGMYDAEQMLTDILAERIALVED